MIRWKAIVPALLFLMALAVVLIVFLDPFAKWAIVKSGQAVFGAKVDIASVRVRLKHTSLTLRGLQIADKSDPWKNLFQVDEAVFDAEALPLLEKKFIIDESSVIGLKFGTKRTSSGALLFEDKRPGFVGNAVKRVWSQVETISLDKFDTAKKYYDPKTVINPDNLKTFQAARDAKDKLEKTPAELKAQIDQLNAEKRVEDLKTRVQALGKNDGTSNALQKIEEVRSIQADLTKLRADLVSTRQSVTEKIQSSQKLVDNVKQAKEEDWKNLKSTLSLPTLDKATIARAVFGPTVAQNIERGLGWVQEGRRYMPAKAAAPPAPPRGRGRTIEFPREKVLPRFLLVKAQVTGEVGHEQPLAFNGTVSGVTSNPELYGKPAVLDFKGGQGPRSFTANALVDHTRREHVERLNWQYKGFALGNYTFGQPDSLGLLIQNGRGNFSGSISIREAGLNGTLGFEAGSVSVKPQLGRVGTSDMAKRLSQSITTSVSQVHSFTLGVGLAGTLSAPEFSLDSNVGGIVANAMKSAVGADVAHQEEALRAELDRLTSAKIQELTGSFQRVQNGALGRLSSQDKVVDDLLTQVKQKASSNVAVPGISGKGLNSLKGLFGH